MLFFKDAMRYFEVEDLNGETYGVEVPEKDIPPPPVVSERDMDAVLGAVYYHALDRIAVGHIIEAEGRKFRVTLDGFEEVK